MIKEEIRRFLFDEAVKALENQGWKVERIPRAGKSSLRKIIKGSISKKVSIRTSQDTWIAFPRNQADNGWATLEDVDYVVASSVDSKEKPCFANVHMIDANDIRARFDRAYKARKAANRAMDAGRGIWISLYDQEVSDPVYYVGAGAGLANPPIAHIPLAQNTLPAQTNEQDSDFGSDTEIEEPPLTIAEATRRLALSLGVDIGDIKITVSS